MNESLREFEGTWEEVAAQSGRWTGHRVRLTLLDDTQQGPVTPTITGKNPQGIVTDVNAFLASLPQVEDDGELWEAIAENRAMRRQLAKEKNE